MAASRRIETSQAGWLDPAEVFVRLFADAEQVFWLDSGADAETGFSVMGRAARTVVAELIDADVTATAAAVGRVRVIDDDGAPVLRDGSVFDLLREILGGTGPWSPDGSARTETLGDPTGGDRGYWGGWVGWLGYEAGASAVGVPVARTETPEAVLLRADDVIVFDHAVRRVMLVSSDSDWIVRTARALGEIEASPDSAVVAFLADHPAVGGDATPRWSGAEYRALVEACQERIRAGDAYQLCLTNQLRVPGTHDPVATYLRLRASSPSHHGGFLRAGDTALLSASPEQFLEIGTDRIVRTKPIKGTRPRGATPEEDAQLASELLASEKERAENLMIVDLMRNDLARVAEVGSVAVTGLHVVESYPHVHQLVSTVEGRLRPGVGVVDAIEACFPAGSMTGAPKRSAMTILHGLERGPRGVYAGTFGVFWDDGATDLAMVIRSIVVGRHTATIGTGGGITALSVPAEELAETETKARALLRTLGIEGDPAESR
ncbi:aminodeoxychorismate synthase component I [Plantibacter sp. Mn2098]|uniref:aminodeoxychorismate synthase component I n=1 Tax=Plantibacter sp. Mn2098 TaxID=3395266 RepID=UPI003BCB7559